MKDRRSTVVAVANWIATYISIQQMKIDFDAVPLITPLVRAAPHCRGVI